MVKAGEKMTVNVKAARVGAVGKAPVKREVMSAVTMPDIDASSAGDIEVKSGTKTITMGGRSWNTEWSEVSGAKSWMADGLIIKSTFNGDTSMELTKWETDAKPELDWSKGEGK